jgi:hypothetical protein
MDKQRVLGYLDGYMQKKAEGAFVDLPRDKYLKGSKDLRLRNMGKINEMMGLKNSALPVLMENYRAVPKIGEVGYEKHRALDANFIQHYPELLKYSPSSADHGAAAVNFQRAPDVQLPYRETHAMYLKRILQEKARQEAEAKAAFNTKFAPRK